MGDDLARVENIHRTHRRIETLRAKEVVHNS